MKISELDFKNLLYEEGIVEKVYFCGQIHNIFFFSGDRTSFIMLIKAFTSFYLSYFFQFQFFRYYSSNLQCFFFFLSFFSFLRNTILLSRKKNWEWFSEWHESSSIPRSQKLHPGLVCKIFQWKCMCIQKFRMLKWCINSIMYTDRPVIRYLALYSHSLLCRSHNTFFPYQRYIIFPIFFVVMISIFYPFMPAWWKFQNHQSHLQQIRIHR